MSVVERVLATEEALALIDLLKRNMGPLCFINQADAVMAPHQCVIQKGIC